MPTAPTVTTAQQLRLFPPMLADPLREETHPAHGQIDQYWRSPTRPDLCARSTRERAALTWAEQHPVAYTIVSPGSRSHAFGPGSSVYIGWAQRSPGPEATMKRLLTLYHIIHNYGLEACGPHIFRWRAAFTVRHYRDKGFTGGYFTLVCPPNKHSSEILSLDYTPDTVLEVAGHFLAWAIQHHGRSGWIVQATKRHGREPAYTWDLDTLHEHMPTIQLRNEWPELLLEGFPVYTGPTDNEWYEPLAVLE